MDHLPEPKRDYLPPIRVPLIEPVVRYDSEGFESFPSRHALTSALQPDSNPTELARCLQSWLFFGLLSEYLGNDFHQEDFIQADRNDAGIRYLSLRNLPSRQLDRDIDADRLARWESRAEGACSVAWNKIRDLELRGRLGSSPAEETALAVLVLVKTLQVIANGPSRDEPKPQQWESSFLRSYMLNNHWCPQQVNSLMSDYDPLVLSYLARLQPPGGRVLSHEQCSESRCIANNARLDSQYRHRHRTENCSCNYIAVDSEAVKAVIQQGSIPLIAVCSEPNGRISLSVKAAGPHSCYVAISHVWSDGLGNPNANALPQCQLENIQRCLEQMPLESDMAKSYLQSNEYLLSGIRVEEGNQNAVTPIWFWMDTLCIPVAPPQASLAVLSEINHIKSLAINQMGLVYAAASQVLVLDAGLQSMIVETPHHSSDLEPLGRFACSSWMQRCWTLQEGALSSLIRFQTASCMVTPLGHPRYAANQAMLHIIESTRFLFFATLLKAWDRNIKIELLRRKAGTINCSSPVPAHIRYNLQTGISRTINMLPRGPSSHSLIGQAMPSSQLRQFCIIWNSLSHRNTTMAEDIPAIFANLLSVHAYGILEAPPHLRMLAILKSLKLLPLSLLFNHGPRPFGIQNSGNRWVPSETSSTKMHASVNRRSGEDVEVVETSLTWTGDNELQLVGSQATVLVVLENIRSLAGPATLEIEIADDDQSPLSRRLLIFFDRPDIDSWVLGDEEKLMLLLEMDETEVSAKTLKMGCLLGVRGFTSNKSNRQARDTLEVPCYIPLSQSPGDSGEEKAPQEFLHFAPREESVPDSIRLIGRYDCPITWRAAAADSRQDHQEKEHTICATPLRHPWELRILTDGKDFPGESPQRPHPEALKMSILNAAGILLLMPMIPIFFANIGIRIAIETKLGSPSRDVLRIISIVAFAVEVHPLTSILAPPPLAQALFLASRWIDAEKMGHSPLEHTWLTPLQAVHVALSLVFNLWTFALAFLVGARCTKIIVRLVWFDSFRPDWKDDPGWVWKFLSRAAKRWKILNLPGHEHNDEPEGDKKYLDVLVSKF